MFESWSGYQNQTAAIGRCLVLLVRPIDENIGSTKGVSVLGNGTKCRGAEGPRIALRRSEPIMVGVPKPNSGHRPLFGFVSPAY